MLTLVIQEMSKEFPTLMETLVHERDQLVSFAFIYVMKSSLMSKDDSISLNCVFSKLRLLSEMEEKVKAIVDNFFVSPSIISISWISAKCIGNMWLEILQIFLSKTVALQLCSLHLL
jgi:hypothetical protein